MKKLLALSLLFLSSLPGTAQAPGPQAGPAFDVNAATQAYLAKMSPEQKARSDAYFEGGYWLILWDFLVTAGIALLLLSTRWSARMRNRAESDVPQTSRSRRPSTGLQYAVATVGAGLSAHLVRGLPARAPVRPRDADVRPVAGRLGQGPRRIASCSASLAVPCSTESLRRAGKTWWIWGALAAVVFLAFVRPDRAGVHRAALQQVHAARGPEGPGSDPVAGARQRHPAPRDVYVFDASRQSTRDLAPT